MSEDLGEAVQLRPGPLFVVVVDMLVHVYWYGQTGSRNNEEGRHCHFCFLDR